MYCFYSNGKVIYKQDITFYKDEVKKLRKEIINNCSFITHEEYESDYEPSIDDCFIRNLRRKFVGYKDYFEERRMVFHYSYDHLTPPYLVNLIDRLLNNDSSVIYEIDHYDYSNETNIDDIINKKQLECKKIDDENYSKKIEALKELEKLFNVKKINKNQKSTKDYYYKLLSYIQRKNICKLDVKDFNNVCTFLDIDVKIKNGIVTSKQSFVKQYKKIK